MVAGGAIGVLCHEKIWFPTLPGNVMNAWTYNFPVQFQFLREVDNKMIFVGEKAAYERILEGCKELRKYGVRAVTGACGFFGHYQKRLAAKLDIPVALSSLVQLPWIAATLKPDEKIAVLTANEESCTPDLLRACSVPDEVIERCVIRGLGKEPQFKVILDDSCEFDNAQIKQELLGKAEEMSASIPRRARSCSSARRCRRMPT